MTKQCTILTGSDNGKIPDMNVIKTNKMMAISFLIVMETNLTKFPTAYDF